MNPAIATFEDVQHVQRVRANRATPRYTRFSFMENGKLVPCVVVPGWPSVDRGITVTALLTRDGDWKSLVGWVNHATGEVAAPDYRRHAAGAVIGLAFAAFWMLWNPFHHAIYQLMAGVAGVAIAAVEVRTYRLKRRQAVALREVAAELAANPSIERTASSGLRPLPAAAHVER